MLQTAPPFTSEAARPDLGVRTAGLGALGFASIVIAQNVIRGGSAPANDASPADVLQAYADHRTITYVLVTTFVVSAICLTVFLGGAARPFVASSRPGWAYTGLVGAIGVLALFGIVVATEQALSVVARGPDPDLGAIQALWVLHTSVFSVLELAIAVALVGLGRAGVAAGTTPKVFERLAPVGAVLLAVGAIAGPWIVAGDAMALFGVSAIGFVLWLAFLITTGLRMVRS